MDSQDRGSIARFRSPLSTIVQGLIDEVMDEAKGHPPQGEGTSAQSKGKELAHIVSFDKSSSTVSLSSHGGGDGGRSNETCGTSEYYQHDEVEDVQEFQERLDPNRSYQWRQRVLPPRHSNEQGNMGGDVGGEQVALWNPSYSEPHSDS